MAPACFKQSITIYAIRNLPEMSACLDSVPEIRWTGSIEEHFFLSLLCEITGCQAKMPYSCSFSLATNLETDFGSTAVVQEYRLTSPRKALIT